VSDKEILRVVLKKAASIAVEIEKQPLKDPGLRLLAVHAMLAGFWAKIEDTLHPREDGESWKKHLMGGEARKLMEEIFVKKAP
jgi:hypothetical protein